MSGHILLVDDDHDLLRLLTMRLRANGYRISAVGSAEAALTAIDAEPPQVVISDVRLPGQDGLDLFETIRSRYPALPVILLTAHGTIPDAVAATARGVFDYLTKPFDSKVLLARIAKALALTPRVPTPDSADDWRAPIVSCSAAMANVLAEARLVAGSDASVLIRGESGTGKELLAQAIHRASPRRQRPFVAVNCGAIPEPLLESELFGHVRGAFTGAVSNHAGLFRAADGGTLFLDEIGDMAPSLQVKLLRAIQEKCVRAVGASQSQAVNVRIISATHRDLEAALPEGSFREDLYYRLNVMTLTLPPLSGRREDIPLLANHFLGQLAEKYDRRFSGFAPDALLALAAAPWPGNVRQLYNVIEQVCALSTTSLIPLSLVQRALRSEPADMPTYADACNRFSRDYLSSLLKLTAGNIADAARVAGRNRTEFYRLLQRHDIDADLFRSTLLSPSGNKSEPL